MDDPLDALRARWLIIWLVVAAAVGSLSLRIVQRHGPGFGPADEVIATAFSFLLSSAVLIAGPALQSRAARVALSEMNRKIPASSFLPIALMALPLLGVTAVGTYLLWAPLSLALPNLTSKLILSDSPRIFARWGTDCALANGLAAVSITVVVPIAEESFFRGLLLRRWTRKWGSLRAVLASSAVFSILHVDPLGALVFGIVMCGLYSKYHSIWAPIIVHAAKNAIGWGMGVLSSFGTKFLDTPAELRAAWWLPLLGLLLALPLILRFRSDFGPMSSWTFDPRR